MATVVTTGLGRWIRAAEEWGQAYSVPIQKQACQWSSDSFLHNARPFDDLRSQNQDIQRRTLARACHI